MGRAIFATNVSVAIPSVSVFGQGGRNWGRPSLSKTRLTVGDAWESWLTLAAHSATSQDPVAIAQRTQSSWLAAQQGAQFPNLGIEIVARPDLRSDFGPKEFNKLPVGRLQAITHLVA
jgi:hypothetical protein